MVRGPRGRFLRRLADLTVRPPADHYRAPPDRLCFKDQYSLDLSEEVTLTVVYKVFRGLIVHFVINHSVLANPKSINIARIDTCHGMIHRHQYDQAGVDLLDHQLIRVIPAGRYDVVNEGFPDALAIMQNEWEANLRRWRGDAE